MALETPNEACGGALKADFSKDRKRRLHLGALPGPFTPALSRPYLAGLVWYSISLVIYRWSITSILSGNGQRAGPAITSPAGFVEGRAALHYRNHPGRMFFEFPTSHTTSLPITLA